MAAGLRSLTVMQQAAVLPDVMSCSSAISACGNASNVSRPRCSRLLVRPLSYPTMPPYLYSCIFSACDVQCLWEGPSVAAGLW